MTAGPSGRAAIDSAAHSPYSDPGRWSDLLIALPTDVAALSATAGNVIAHYRVSMAELPEATRHDVHSRWLERILTLDQERHDRSLSEPRDLSARVQGCCRDYTLFCIGVLRTHGIPSRSRVGFAGYFHHDWNADHVIVECWTGQRWRRFDAQLNDPIGSIDDPTDIASSEPGDGGFVTAAQVWQAYRHGDVDPNRYGVDPAIPMLSGPRFLHTYLVHEAAHRYGDELLLWDIWGRMDDPFERLTNDDLHWADELAALLIAADGEEPGAEEELAARYQTDPDVKPGPVILRASPFDDSIERIELG